MNVIDTLNHLSTTAASRANTLPLGCARLSLEAAAMYWGQLAAALDRGVEISAERFAEEVEKADNNNRDAGEYGLPEHVTDELLEAYGA